MKTTDDLKKKVLVIKYNANFISMHFLFCIIWLFCMDFSLRFVLFSMYFDSHVYVIGLLYTIVST